METIYDVDYFISKFSAIPEDMWGVGTFENLHGERCTMGHCGMKSDNYKNDGRLNEESSALASIIRNAFHCDSYESDYCVIYKLNDRGSIVSTDHRYMGDTPKARILAALNDIKAMTQPKPKPEPKPLYENITHELAILPIDETSDKTSTPKPLKQLQ